MDNQQNKYSIDTTDYQVGQDNLQKWGFDIHNPVFGISAGLILLFIAITLVVEPATAKAVLNDLKNGIMKDFDLLFMWSTNFFLVFAIILMFSPLGKVRIGAKETYAEYTTASWLAMLFAAGMGIGLLFWGVAEPTAYFTDWWGIPFNVAPYTSEAKAIVNKCCPSGSTLHVMLFVSSILSVALKRADTKPSLFFSM